eukprot:CAMPEP_0116140378 /NCGR_PEP_ID=MMETSP0329-20121206/13811_1 /TAXON_ID=697910 /ORGANISM="Pseudo-nitzschia arenysensis, Strain B593" /LENGTH=458 /DNA_ID=CAMNT_0003635479 /DNA_START=19 /DNA_END=1395 /DNA_ORIENTATION=-
MTKSLDHLDLARGSDHHGLRVSQHSVLRGSEHIPLKRSEHTQVKGAENRQLKVSNHRALKKSKVPKKRDLEEDDITDSSEIVPFVHIDHPFHLKNDLKFAFTYSDDSVSIGSSVCSGMRNTLLSSLSSLSFEYDYDDVESSSEGSSSGDSSCIDGRVFPSWRLRPSESKSDYTMTIESVPEGTIKKYHVHKKMLSRNGKKTSDFFSRLFADSSIKKKKVIKIHEDAARLIGKMLDYMYSLDDKLHVTSETAVGLRHLSQFFGIRALAKRVAGFIQDDICIENMDIYMETAGAYDDMQTTKLCADCCASQIGSIHPLSPLVAEMDPSFILAIISSDEFARESYSKHMSHIMTGYFITQRGAIDGQVFEELTCKEYIPNVDLEAALPLLILEAALVDESPDDSTTSLSCLQQRCVEGILPLFRPTKDRTITEQEKKSRETAMLKVPKKVLVQILSTISAE